MKKITLLLLLSSTLLIAQKEKSSKMGQTTLDELKMTTYHKDSTATAVVLYEHANYYKEPLKDFQNRTDYYFRIKILNKNSFDLANITINLYKEKSLIDVKAITYNLNESGVIDKSNLLEKDIFTIKEGDNLTVKKFTLPNIKEGSIIEYTYSILSPYQGISDWYFQSNIPKIKSEYDAAILGNYKYNIRVKGFLKLNKDSTSIKKNCVFIPIIGNGSCVILSYGMIDIPAFKEENHMLSKKNYISRLSFDLKSYTQINGHTKNYTTTWKKADKSFKNHLFNNQTSKKSFFRKNIPEAILNTENSLEKASKIFYFIQNYFTWNEKYWTNEDLNTKQAFQEKNGNIGEINLSLYNSLKAADIDVSLVVLSTRNNGVPTKLFPVIFDFNYVIVKAVINNKEYYLDATKKFLPFGQVPIRALNGEARTINYKEESTWNNLKPLYRTTQNVSAKLKLNNEGVFKGELKVRKDGYYASKQRERISFKSDDDYLDDLESKLQDIEIEDYKVENLDSIQKPLQETFKISLETDDTLAHNIRINPFLFDRITKNPFKLNERNYPVDYAYARRNTFFLNLEIPNNYKIVKLPGNKAISLPNKGGKFILNTSKKGNLITVYVKLEILKKVFSAEEYYYLKEFYKQVIISESGYIMLEKTK
jgi:hypothetical protein